MKSNYWSIGFSVLLVGATCSYLFLYPTSPIRDGDYPNMNERIKSEEAHAGNKEAETAGSKCAKNLIENNEKGGIASKIEATDSAGESEKTSSRETGAIREGSATRPEALRRGTNQDRSKGRVSRRNSSILYTNADKDKIEAKVHVAKSWADEADAAEDSEELADSLSINIEMANDVPVKGLQFTLNDAPNVLIAKELKITSRTEGFIAKFVEDRENGITLMLVPAQQKKFILPGNGSILKIVYNIRQGSDPDDVKNVELIFSNVSMGGNSNHPLKASFCGL